MSKDTARDKYLRRVYGISLGQYNLLLVKQKLSCWICGKHKDDLKQSLSVDHDHKTMRIRGLLCSFCNRRLIGRHRDADLFDKAAEYLRQDTGLIVPKKKKKKRTRKRR